MPSTCQSAYSYLIRPIGVSVSVYSLASFALPIWQVWKKGYLIVIFLCLIKDQVLIFSYVYWSFAYLFRVLFIHIPESIFLANYIYFSYYFMEAYQINPLLCISQIPPPCLCWGNPLLYRSHTFWCIKL